MTAVRAMFFDVFGTLVDWRTSVAREAERILGPLGHDLDWLAFADAWRGEYQPGMEEVRSGRIPFCRLDVLHRHNLERFIPRFGLRDLSEDVLNELTLAWHRLDAWPDVPAALVGDPGRLRQVLLNLVGNAVKFTDEGEVAVDVAVAERSADEVLLKVTVRDTGIGIPEDKKWQIFGAFVQADASTTRRRTRTLTVSPAPWSASCWSAPSTTSTS